MPWSNNGWDEPAIGKYSAFGPGVRRALQRRDALYNAGPPVAGRNQPIHRPHYTDKRFQGKEHTLYGATAKDLSYEYSDRLWQWDYDKAQESAKVANESGHANGSPAWYEVYLTHYHGVPVQLLHIIGGVNVSSGYEYYVFGFRFTEVEG
jgi:hypothetical protein